MNERGTYDELITETTLADGILFRLPVRGECSEEARHAWKLIFISGAVTVAAFVGVVLVITQASRWTLMVPALVPGFIGAIGGTILAITLFCIYGHADIRIADRGVWVTDRLWMLKWTRRRKAALAGVRIEFDERDEDKDCTDDADDDSMFDATLVADVVAAKPICIAFGYPLELLQRLATLISETCSVDRDEGERPERPLPQQPVSSKVELTRGVGELSIMVPASGYGNGSQGFVPAAIIWLGLVFTFSFFVYLAGALQDPAFAVFLLVFHLFGFGVLIYGLTLTHGRMYLDIVDGTLLVSERRLLRGVRQHRWTRTDIDSIVVGTGNVAVNEENLYELCVRVNETFEIKSCNFLLGREPEELRWIAYELRTALGLED